MLGKINFLWNSIIVLIVMMIVCASYRYYFRVEATEKCGWG